MDENGSPLFGLALNCSRRSSSATTNWRAAQLQRPHKRNRELSRWRRAASAQHRLSGQEYRRNQRTGRHLHLPLNRRPKVKLLLPLQLLRRRRRLLANRPCSSMATSTTMSMSQQQRKASFELKLEIQLNPSQSSSIVVHEIPPTVSSIDQRPHGRRGSSLNVNNAAAAAYSTIQYNSVQDVKVGGTGSSASSMPLSANFRSTSNHRP